jgi:hypothetical protein
MHFMDDMCYLIKRRHEKCSKMHQIATITTFILAMP